MHIAIATHWAIAGTITILIAEMVPILGLNYFCDVSSTSCQMMLIYS